MKIILLSGLLFVLVGCSTFGPHQQAELDRLEARVVAKLVLEHPGLQGELSASRGYMVADMRVGDLSLLGAPRSNAVVVDPGTEERVYVQISEWEIDGGWGLGSYTALISFPRLEDLEAAKRGAWSYAATTTHRRFGAYIYVGGEPSVRYALLKAAVKPVGP